MEQSDLLVRRIKDGTVIDHINEGKGLNVLEALEIDGSSGNVITIALNMPSGKLKKNEPIRKSFRKTYSHCKHVNGRKWMSLGSSPNSRISKTLSYRGNLRNFGSLG